MFGPLISTEWLAAHIDEPDLRVADVRWYLDPAKQGRAAYVAGHIPGAVFLDADADLAAPGGGRGLPAGRHPWPDAEQVARVMSRAGIGERTRVVAYDDQAGAIAARLWYLLRAYGHDEVAVLDGGIAKWIAEARLLETATPSPAPATFTPRPRSGLVLTKAEMLAIVREGRAPVLDARAPERYRGESEPIDPRAGHIPGALNAPFTGNLSEGSPRVMRSPAELRERYRTFATGGETPVFYCGSGITACHGLLALDVAGLRGRLYAGSWSEWSSDPELPVETTPGPSRA
jgi:thiosulfate/3-mercaptopyruvate sulfurtransferase